MSEPSAAPHAAATAPSMIETPPATMGGILRRLGPGLIIAASIVGSGELIGTTKTGADAGYTLLWLIVIGCVIKVFVQVEFGRFTIVEGRGTMDAMDAVPGPRARVSWLVWYWLLMFMAMMGQLGGIGGTVGQTLANTFPLTGDFAAALRENRTLAEVYTYDDIIWTALVVVVTSILLVNGRYGLIQSVSTALVAGFTLLTIFNVFALPWFSDADIGWGYIFDGLKFHLPEQRANVRPPVATALATFGIIGVGASEVITYPYWCLEKGYARFTGPMEQSDSWLRRARGWLRVMQWDVWCSMIIYTFATIAFYVLGAAVLFPRRLSPASNKLVPVLATMYEDVFGAAGEVVFLVGTVAVLYSTFFVASAGNARAGTDTLRVFRLIPDTTQSRRKSIRVLSGLIPFVCLGIYSVAKDPVTLVLISGMMQAIMLPLLGVTAIYFRFRRTDPRLTPGPAWTACLCVSVVLMAGVASWSAWTNAPELVASVRSWFAR